MKCKNCNEKEATKYSKYSSGEFCCRECARSYSTKDEDNKTKIINCCTCGKQIEVNKRSDPKITRCETCKIKFGKKRKIGWRSGKKEIKICKNCGNEFEILSIKVRAGGGVFCSRKCHIDYLIDNGKTEEERKHWNIAYQKKYRYKLLEEEYINLISNENCMICGKNFEEGEQKCIDHDHKDGKVRGILCHSCNRGLGNFKDSQDFLEKAIIYLNKK